MQGSRLLAGSILLFVGGLGAALLAMDRYEDAFVSVTHTRDVRIAIGRAVGNAGSSPSCNGLRAHVATFTRLTADNPVQQRKVPALRASVELVCRNLPAPDLIDQLGAADATERAVLMQRRARLADLRRWTLLALVLSALGGTAAIALAQLIQRRALRSIAAGEERFRTLATSSRDLVRIHDAAGRPTYVSPSVEHLLGYSPAEFLRMAPLSLGHPDDMDRLRQALADVRQAHAPGSTLVYRLRKKDGTYAWFETHTNPIRDDDGVLLRFYTAARDVTERIELEQKLELATVTDALTGLLNRRGFLMTAGQEHRVAIRHEHGLAVIFADLDGLKTINDRLGHDHGDRALCAFADVLRRTFRDSDVVARLGGDEYAALAFHVDAAAIDFVLARLRRAVAEAPPVGPYPLSVSLGVALLEPGQTASLDELIAVADKRMYENKRARRANRPVTDR